MSSGQLRTIAAVVAVLLVLWGASELVSRRPQRASATLRLPAIKASDVDTVRIIHVADTVVLAKQDSAHWTVNGFSATPGSVTELLEATHDSAAAPPELVAQNPASFDRMGVDSAGGRWVRFRSHRSGAETVIIVGKTGSDYDSYYLRLPGDQHVYLVHNRLASFTQRGVDDWRDHAIAKVPADSVHAVEVTRGKERYTLRRNGSTWSFGGGGAADSGLVKRLVERFASLSGSGFAAPRTVDSLARQGSRATRAVTLRGDKGRALLSLSIDSTTGVFWVRKQGDPTVYRLDSWNVDQITPSAQSLKPAQPKS
ncbi:MAG TPA: DUF4340 domain-containing protein [Gemmatimonadales bacterium]|nr:DUF4340 domain-containing protein [Gemmatimonadales bacterium]